MRGAIYEIRIDRPGREPSFYVGQSINHAEREQQHRRALRAGRHDNRHLQRSFAKYGEDALSFRTIMLCAFEDLDRMEQLVLDQYTAAFGLECVVNVMRECVRTHRGVKRSAETIARMSAAQKGRKKSPEEIERMRVSATGKRWTEETRAKMVAAFRGRKMHPNSRAALEKVRSTPEWKASISAGKMASLYVHSDETKAKIAASLTGKKSTPEANAKRSAAMRGRRHTAEHIEKRVAARRANAIARVAS